MTRDEFLFHYQCEWDTNEFLGWDEVWICIEQLYGRLQDENEQLKKYVRHLKDCKMLPAFQLKDKILPEIPCSCGLAQILEGE